MPRNHSLLGPTGSLVNNLAANAKQITPKAGDGATELMYSDRHAYTVMVVVDSRTLVLRRDKATRSDLGGASDVQSYTYAPDPHGCIRYATRRKNGRWVTVGENQWRGTTWLIGHREEYYDYSR